jgi:hypothetical protein
MPFVSTLLFALVFIAPPVKPITIRVDKTVFFAGQDLTVTCLVPRHEDNRKVEALLLPDYTSSEKQLNGDSQDPIYNTFMFKQMPSEVTSAACQLTDKYAHHVHVTQTLQVIAPQ